MIKDTLTYDIVGSFLRPAEIKEARKAYKDGKITKEELTQAIPILLLLFQQILLCPCFQIPFIFR